MLEQGLSVSQVARDLDIRQTVLLNWVKQAKVDRGDPGGAMTTEETEEFWRIPMRQYQRIKAASSVTVRGIAALSVLLIILAPTRDTSAEDSRPVVAVFDIQVKDAPLSAAIVEKLTDLVAQELGLEGVFQIMPPGDVKNALREQAGESYKQCYNEKCQIDLGRQLPANKLLSTSITKIGDNCRVVGLLYDLRRQTTDTIAKENAGCSESELAGALESVAGKLRTWRKGGVDPSARQESLSDAVVVPIVKIASAGLSEISIMAEELLERAQDLQEKQQAKPEDRRSAWCALAEYSDNNPYREQARKACEQWTAFIEGSKKLEENSRKDYLTLISFLYLKRRSDQEKKNAMDAFLWTYRSMANALEFETIDYLRSKWPMTVGDVEEVISQMNADDKGIIWMHSLPAGIEFTRSEITVAQYRTCVQAGNCSDRNSKKKQCNWGRDGRDNHPINCVNWHDATAFCIWAGGRLPTREEWFAEASNKGTRKYPWGNTEVTCDYAVFREIPEKVRSGEGGCGRNSTWPVCSKRAGNSVSGLCDMSGNVWEWTSTSEGSTSEGSGRAKRGGSWFLGGSSVVVENWAAFEKPTSEHTIGGFRCVRLVAP